MLIDYSTGWVAPTLGEELRRRLFLNLLPRPLLILWVQSDLALVHCPSINGNNLDGETNKQTNKWGQHIVGRILVCCKTCLQVPDSRVQAWSQQSCLRRDKIQYFWKVLQNSPLTSHKMQLNRAILTMILPCQ